MQVNQFSQYLSFNLKNWVLIGYVCILLHPLDLLGQATNLGTPQVISYTKKLMQSGTQTWDIAIDSLGFHYFANNKGLLVFDGNTWAIYKLPNKTIARSVALDKQGRIYVGGQGEFGYFYPKKNGQLDYKSLSSLIVPSISFGDVWEIIHHDSKTFFRSDYHVFMFDQDNTVKVLYHTGKSLLTIGVLGKELMVQDDTGKFFKFQSGKFEEEKALPPFTQGRIASIINYRQDTILFATNHNAIYALINNKYAPWKTAHDKFFIENVLYTATYHEGIGLILGTSFSGVVILNESKKIVQYMNKKHGLQNNTVLSTASTNDGNIWLGLDNGIDLIDLHSPFSYFSPDETLEGTGYTAMVHNENIYFGTNTGLYVLPWKTFYLPEEKNKAKLINGTSGQVWSINKLQDQLLIGHHNGAFSIINNHAQKISNRLGIWKFLLLDNEHALAGYYHGLLLFKKDQSKGWVEEKTLKNFDESARIVSEDRFQNIWISHPYRGVYVIPKIDIQSDQINAIKFSDSNPAKIQLDNTFFDVMSTILLRDSMHVYTCKDYSKKPELFTKWDDYLKPVSKIRFMFSDDYRNIWYGTEQSTFLLLPKKSFTGEYKSFEINALTGLLPEGFESVYTIDQNNVIFPTEKGFAIFNPEKYINDTVEIKLNLVKIELNSPKDSILYIGHKNALINQLNINLEPSENSLSFYFSNLQTGKTNHIKYSYKLEGKDYDWSNWSSSGIIKFAGLAPGSYNLIVKAQNHSMKEGSPFSIPFKIRYPWYRSPSAYFGYLLLLGTLGYFLYSKQQSNHEKEKSLILASNQKREKEHLLMAEASKLKITELQNDKLQTELNFKNQELTSFTYHLVNKNELITEINSEINRLETKFHDKPEVKKELKQILKLTEQNVGVDADWDNFIKSFDQVHVNFFKRLHDEYKELSPNDYKMCTYLRMNLSSKEIAALMNISIRSVETNRYRLRKKLSLDSGTNLTQFLMDF